MAIKGKPVQFCPRKVNLTAECAGSVIEVTGVDLQRLTDRTTSPGGTITGKATLRGRSGRDGLRVIRQTAQSRVIWPAGSAVQPGIGTPQCSPVLGPPSR